MQNARASTRTPQLNNTPTNENHHPNAMMQNAIPNPNKIFDVIEDREGPKVGILRKL